MSPGFWNTPGTAGGSEDGSADDEEATDDSEEDDRFEEEPEPVKLPIYVSIGEMIERGEEVIVCRDDDDHYIQEKGDPWDLFGKLRRMGGRVVGNEKGWLQLRGVSLDDVRRLRSCEGGNGGGGGLRTAWAGGARARGRAPAQGGRKAAAIHLIDRPNPPEYVPDHEVREADDNPPLEDGWVFPLRKWMKNVIEWQLGWREVSTQPT